MRNQPLKTLIDDFQLTRDAGAVVHVKFSLLEAGEAGPGLVHDLKHRFITLHLMPRAHAELTAAPRLAASLSIVS